MEPSRGIYLRDLRLELPGCLEVQPLPGTFKQKACRSA